MKTRKERVRGPYVRSVRQALIDRLFHLGLTYSELARMSGISRQCISSFANGRTAANSSTLSMLHEALDRHERSLKGAN